MGLFFTLFYLFATYMGPQVLFGDLAQYHIQILIAALALFFSLPSLQGSDLLRAPQTFGVIGLIAAVPLSLAFNGWFGGAPTALFDFLPDAMVFFFVALNCKKKIHLQILIAVLLFTAVFNVSQGLLSERAGRDASLYVITMKNNSGEIFYRIRGVNFLNDPNDLAQFILMLIPCLFFFWSKGKKIRNLLFVLLPVSYLLVGMYFTHSRGSMIALMAATIIAGRRKLGVTRSLVAGAVLYIGMSVAGFSGGRSTSLDSGADRMDSWAAGLGMIRSHPFFGVGINQFRNFHKLTAHNSVVLCAAETGLVGLFFWMLIAVPTVRDAFVGSGPLKSNEAAASEKESRKIVPERSDASSGFRHPAALAFSPQPQSKESRSILRGALATGGSSLDLPAPAFTAPVPPGVSQRYLIDPKEDTDELPPAEIHRLLSLMLISLTGFLTAGWFLPRTYTMTMFVEAGIVMVVYRMGRQQQIVLPPLPFPRAAKFASLACVGFVGLVWMILRFSHL